MKINGRVLLKDLRPISQQEFDIAAHVCATIKKIVTSRQEYIKQHNIDPEIALPSANWTEDAHMEWWYNIYRYVASSQYKVINNLRLYTQAFSGYELKAMAFNPFVDAQGVRKEIAQDIPANFDEIVQKLSPRPDKFVTNYLNITKHLPEWMIAKAPKCLGEIGWDVDGGVVNYDVYSYQERLNFLYEAGIINWLREKSQSNVPVNILEIGAGYGGLASFIKRILPKANYFICDLPESLIFSSLYLGITRSDCAQTIYDGTNASNLNNNDAGFKFIPNFMFDDAEKGGIKFDLAINTLSLSEMSNKQVQYYAQKLKSMLGDQGIFFEQNQDNTHHGWTYAKKILAEHFGFKRRVFPITVHDKCTSGEIDLWANRNLADILVSRYQPFKGTFLGLLLRIRFLFSITFLKIVCRKLIGPRFYQMAGELLTSIRNRKAPRSL